MGWGGVWWGGVGWGGPGVGQDRFGWPSDELGEVGQHKRGRAGETLGMQEEGGGEGIGLGRAGCKRGAFILVTSGFVVTLASSRGGVSSRSSATAATAGSSRGRTGTGTPGGSGPGGPGVREVQGSGRSRSGVWEVQGSGRSRDLGGPGSGSGRSRDGVWEVQRRGPADLSAVPVDLWLMIYEGLVEPAPLFTHTPSGLSQKRKMPTGKPSVCRIVHTHAQLLHAYPLKHTHSLCRCIHQHARTIVAHIRTQTLAQFLHEHALPLTHTQTHTHTHRVLYPYLLTPMYIYCTHTRSHARTLQDVVAQRL